jgi:glucosamine--fructose-6-phosphate aminotransferase (isomerizing)
MPGDEGVDLSELGLDDDFLRGLRRIVIVACGTSYHAGLVGRYAIEEWARVPVEMDVASEYRYRNPVVGEGDLVIGITQSGETADTLAAMRLARERGATVLAVTNIMGSQATRDADAVLYTRSGVEISVAATKTFVAQVAAMYLIGLWLAELRGTLPAERLAELVAEMKSLPSKVESTLAGCEEVVAKVAAKHAEQQFFLYLGRHIGLPVCLEGALKLKEISYIPTDAYAAGEMKHEGRRGSRRDDRGGRERLDPAADPGDPAPAVARLQHRPCPRAQRRPTPQFGQDRHGRVTL